MTAKEVAPMLGMGDRTFQDHIKLHPYYRLQREGG
jgi:hypothetical protein